MWVVRVCLEVHDNITIFNPQPAKMCSNKTPKERKDYHGKKYHESYHSSKRNLVLNTPYLIFEYHD